MKTYLETVTEEEIQAETPQNRAKKVLVNAEEVVENQIIYTLGAAAAVKKVAIQTFSIPKARL